MSIINNTINIKRLIRTLDAYSRDSTIKEQLESWGGTLESLKRAGVDNEELQVKTRIFSPHGSKEQLFSIEIIHEIDKKKIYTKTIWNPQNNTVSLRWKYEPEISRIMHNSREIETEEINLFPAILNLTSGDNSLGNNKLLEICYKLHTEVFKQVFPEQEFIYEI